MDLLTATAEALLQTSEALLAQHWPRPRPVARRLLHRWHPDRNPHPGATAVFAHLQVAQRLAEAGSRDHQAQATTAAGTFQWTYRRTWATPVGQAWYGRSILVDRVDPLHADLIASAQALLAHPPFATPEMARQIRPCLPPPARHLPGDQGHVLVRPRPVGMVRLAEVRAHLGGSLDPLHVAWIGSALWNLACYLEYAGWVHHHLALDTIWIHPADHRIAVLDPWLFATTRGAPLRALPARTLALAPQAYLDARVAHPHLDHALIRATLRELLGDATGMALPATVPVPMVRFLRLPASGSAMTQYAAWKAALLASFGPPRYVDLPLTATTLDPED